MPFVSLSRLGRGEDIRFARRSVAIFAAGCGLIVFVGMAMLALAYRAADAERSVNHTIEVRQVARELMNSALNAETGVRGFLLTEDPLFLEPYDAALSTLPGRLDELRRLTTDNPEQQAALERVTQTTAAILDVYRQMLALAQQGDRGKRPE